MIVGIDPGASGAVAFYDEGHRELVSAHDAPMAIVGGKTRMDPYAFAALLRSVCLADITKVVIEDVHSMPKQGVASSFAFGRSFGNAEAIVATLGLPLVYVSPVAWKKALRIPVGSDKAYSRLRATQIFGASGEKWWPNKGHHGRAEAAMLAVYGAGHG